MGKIILAAIFTLLLTIPAKSQTCCSGGVPLSGNLGMPASSHGTLQFSLSYDHNVLQTLMFEDERLDDDSRQRLTNSILFEAGYAFTPRISVDLFTSYVTQVRRITNISTQESKTRGLGDAVILGKYRVTSPESSSSLLLGAGVKLASGSSTERNDIGILYAADLQPGSGAVDYILWTNYATILKLRPSMSFSLTGTFRGTGVNDEYLGSLAYEFGDEIQLLFSLADKVNIKTLVIDPSISARYRKAFEDRNNGNAVPNSGGEWVFIIPGISFNITSDLSFNAAIEVPLYSRLVGTQVTPTYRFNSGLYFRINRKTASQAFNPFEIK